MSKRGVMENWGAVKARLERAQGVYINSFGSVMEKDIRAALERIEERETTECREILRLRQRVEELEREKAKVEAHHKAWHREKWGHGPCCTCQKCGQFYDECRCSLDEVAEQLEASRAEVKKYHDALVARHGGEPVALLEELDASKAEIERLEGLILDWWDAPEGKTAETATALCIEARRIRAQREGE